MHRLPKRVNGLWFPPGKERYAIAGYLERKKNDLRIHFSTASKHESFREERSLWLGSGPVYGSTEIGEITIDRRIRWHRQEKEHSLFYRASPLVVLIGGHFSDFFDSTVRAITLEIPDLMPIAPPSFLPSIETVRNTISLPIQTDFTLVDDKNYTISFGMRNLEEQTQVRNFRPRILTKIAFKSDVHISKATHLANSLRHFFSFQTRQRAKISGAAVTVVDPEGI